jgi:hypothetical protein
MKYTTGVGIFVFDREIGSSIKNKVEERDTNSLDVCYG